MAPAYHRSRRRVNNRMITIQQRLISCFVLLLLVMIDSVLALKFNIAAWGDMPYIGSSYDVFNDTAVIGSQKAGVLYRRMVDTINAANVSFITHVGDIKTGLQPCAEPYYTRFEDMCNAMNAPVFYAVGDNEWTDCYYPAAGAHDPLERLNYVRQRFFDPSGATRLGHGNATFGNPTIPNATYPETRLFAYNQIQFIVLHVVGSDNSNNYATAEYGCPPELDAIDPSCQKSHDEFKAREDATIEAIELGFGQAWKSGARGIMIMMQANMFNGPCDPVSYVCGPTFPIDVDDGFDNIWRTIRWQAYKFGKPVALIHGDFHYYQSFVPVPTIPNLVATQVPGDTDIGWVLIEVDTNSTNVFKYTHKDMLASSSW